MSTGNYRQPDYLTENDHPRHRIRCPIHGFIRFSEHERAIIDHPLFRRLRWIRQLALTELVYPGATHTRFEHSLGVMEVATRIFDVLAQVKGGLMEDTFKSVAALKDNPLAKTRQLVRLAALLHDSGHCCFSHAAETVIHKNADHEELTIQMLETPTLLGDLLDKLFFKGAGTLTAQIIAGSKKHLPPQMQVLKDIVSGQVDADRTDYLLRDSYHCGVDYGRFDYRRMIECLALREDPAGSDGLEIAIQRDGIHTFEALILARYQMNCTFVELLSIRRPKASGVRRGRAFSAFGPGPAERPEIRRAASPPVTLYDDPNAKADAVQHPTATRSDPPTVLRFAPTPITPPACTPTGSDAMRRGWRAGSVTVADPRPTLL
jgi:HD domain